MSKDDLIHAAVEPDLSQSGQQSSVPTAGRIAFEGFYAKFPTFDGVAKQWDGSSEEIHQRWEDAADAVIEECAKAVDEHEQRDREAGNGCKDSGAMSSAHRFYDAADAAMLIANALRSLKSNPKGEDHDAS